jgi:DNA-3-methyladenine glycosylase I
VIPVPEVCCGWAPPGDALYRGYHDTEWGVPVRDPVQLFAKLQLDGMQAGLSWITILRKRDSILAEFDGFDPDRLAHWTPERLAKALENPGIIRSPRKAQAAVRNAQLYLDMRAAGINFSNHLWSFVDHRPVVNHWTWYRQGPTHSPQSEAMAKDLSKRGFKFCGPVIVYAFMQAVGMINDHEVGCPRHAEVQALWTP